MNEGAAEQQSPSELDLKNLTQDDFKQFLNEKLKNHACPCCLANKWSLLTAPNMTFGLIAVQKDGGFSLPPPNIPVMGVACNNCGYIRQHAMGLVAQWKAAKKGKA